MDFSDYLKKLIRITIECIQCCGAESVSFGRDRIRIIRQDPDPYREMGKITQNESG